MTNRLLEIRRIMFIMTYTAASVGAYDKWTDEFSRKEIREKFNNQTWTKGKPILEDLFTIEDFKALTPDELRSVGFGIWNENHWLIPLYLINYIKRGQLGLSISGKEKPVEEWDNDHRGGLLAYGFLKD